MATVTLTAKDFDVTAQADGIVLVDFWASWCAPCRRFAPIFEEASEQHPDIVFAKVDTDAEPELAERFGITSIPTLMAIRDGVIVYAEPGALPAPMLESIIEQVRALDMDEVRERLKS
ncbi:thioredoxin [Thermomonospora catenispora]|uniref:thioredoxin n=1 Tax=Thermomonospora catenispora TaxID=2493090 RepID=UPI001124B6B7|nr:thioredoxin [Thermomonospora catenispora]TNY37519.1 thioredoxin [Thermomonospora catenispora]